VSLRRNRPLQRAHLDLVQFGVEVPLWWSFLVPLVVLSTVAGTVTNSPTALLPVLGTLPLLLIKIYAVLRLHTALPRHPELTEFLFTSKSSYMRPLGRTAPGLLRYRPRLRARFVLHHVGADTDRLLYAVENALDEPRYVAELLPELLSSLDTAQASTTYPVLRVRDVLVLRKTVSLDPQLKRETLRLIPPHQIIEFLRTPAGLGGPLPGDGEWMATQVLAADPQVKPLNKPSAKTVGASVYQELAYRPINDNNLRPDELFGSELRSFLSTFLAAAPLACWYDPSVTEPGVCTSTISLIRSLTDDVACSSICCKHPDSDCRTAVFGMLSALGREWDGSLTELAHTGHVLLCPPGTPPNTATTPADHDPDTSPARSE
jgi:hypothetical protein